MHTQIGSTENSKKITKKTDDNISEKPNFNPLICIANQMTTFYMMATLAFNDLIYQILYLMLYLNLHLKSFDGFLFRDSNILLL